MVALFSVAAFPMASNFSSLLALGLSSRRSGKKGPTAPKISPKASFAGACDP
tara:strand:- start:68 stop:223 length:156 start_codon:yes stop_codon:yes gene_type:complete